MFRPPPNNSLVPLHMLHHPHVKKTGDKFSGKIFRQNFTRLKYKYLANKKNRERFCGNGSNSGEEEETEFAMEK